MAGRPRRFAGKGHAHGGAWGWIKAILHLHGHEHGEHDLVVRHI